MKIPWPLAVVGRVFDALVAASKALVWLPLQRLFTPTVEPTIGEMLRRMDNRTSR